MKATVDGIDHQIPEIWIVGYCHRPGRTIEDAVRWWHYQWTLEQQEEEACRES